MTSREPWEYAGAVPHSTVEAPCSCGCHVASTAVNPAYDPSHWPAQQYMVPVQPTGRTRRRPADTVWVRAAKSIGGTVLAVLIVADVGANVAHNAGAVVSRIVPIMHDQPFYFDPLALVHDVEKVIQ
jgi:hypothetical protein